jgi:hypothetical protein
MEPDIRIKEALEMENMKTLYLLQTRDYSETTLDCVWLCNLVDLAIAKSNA